MRRMQCVLCVRKSNLLLIFGKILSEKCTHTNTQIITSAKTRSQPKEINGENIKNETIRKKGERNWKRKKEERQQHTSRLTRKKREVNGLKSKSTLT